MLLALAVSIPALGACSTPDTGPTDLGRLAAIIGHVAPSRTDTCETQRQIAAQSSRIDTIATGKETVYKAACDVAPASKLASLTAAPKR